MLQGKLKAGLYSNIREKHERLVEERTLFALTVAMAAQVRGVPTRQVVYMNRMQLFNTHC